MSEDFDPDKFLAQTDGSFDPDAFLNEDTSITPADSTVDQLMSGIADTASTATGAAVGTGVGALAQRGAAKAINKAAENLGPYSPEQLENIIQNYDQFNTIDPQQTMSKVEDQFRGVNRIANDLEKEAYSNLTAPLTREEYRQTVAKAATPFLKDVPTDTPEFYDETFAAMPKTNPIDPLEAQRQAQLSKFAEESAKAKVAALNNANLGTLPEEQLVAEFNRLKAETMKNPEGFAFVPDQERAAVAASAQQARQAQALRQAEREAVRRLETPLVKDFPEFSGKMLSSAAPVSESEIARLLQEYKYGDKLVGGEPYQLVRNIRELAFDKNSGVRSDAAKAVQKELRELVGSKNPEASNKLKEMSGKIDELKGLEQAGYLKRDRSVSKAKDEFVQLGEKQAAAISKDLSPSKIPMTDDAAQRLAKLKSTLPPDLYQELELGVLKQVALDPKKQLKIGVIDTVMAGMNPMAAAIGVSTKAAKTPKGAIAAARLADTLSQFKGFAGKALPGALGVLGAGVGAASAAQAGEISPEEATVLGTVEAFNPTPLDAIGAYTAGKKEFEESGSIPQTAVAAVQGSVAPIVEAAKLVPEIVEQAGTLKSLSARERMEQNLNAFKGSKTQSAPLVGNYTADDVRATQEWFNASTDPMAQSFKVPLEKAVNAPDERSRAAAMFALEQQPAFRELQRKRK